MLKALFKKQFAEIFKSYFVNQKTGKARAKSASIGFFLLFAMLMVFLAAMFFGMGTLFSEILKIPGLEWFYFALMSMVAIAFGIFGSVFNTYASVYLAKDNELLISMPIPIRTLLISRLAVVVGLSFMYTSVATVPMSIVYLIFGKFDVLSLVFQILLVPMIAIFVSALSCLLGFFVALISSKLRNKSFITVIVSIVFFAGYYFVCFRMSNIINSIITNSAEIGEGIKIWGNLIYQLGMACTGKISSMLIFCGVTAFLFVSCFVVLEKTFIKIATINKGEKKVEYKKKVEKQSSVQNAILKKELKRFTSSATYMLNCGLGVIIMPIVAIAVLVKRETLLSLIEELKQQYAVAEILLPIIIAGVICLMASVGSISTPSVSLEGKNIWIYKSLPIDPYLILKSKIRLHIYIIGLPVIFSSVVVGYAIGLDYSKIIYITVLGYIFVSLSGSLGLVLGLLKANLNWVSETTPIKQSMAVMINMLIGFAIPIGFVGLAFIIRAYITADEFLICTIVVFALLNRWLDRWIKEKGTIKFENL